MDTNTLQSVQLHNSNSANKQVMRDRHAAFSKIPQQWDSPLIGHPYQADVIDIQNQVTWLKPTWNREWQTDRRREGKVRDDNSVC